MSVPENNCVISFGDGCTLRAKNEVNRIPIKFQNKTDFPGFLLEGQGKCPPLNDFCPSLKHCCPSPNTLTKETTMQTVAYCLPPNTFSGTNPVNSYVKTKEL